jgi:hypothetical protein
MIGALARLAWEDARQALGRLCLGAVGMGLATALLSLGAAATLGIRDGVLGRLVQILPVDLVEVQPKRADLGLLGSTLSHWLGGGGTAELNADSLRQLAALPEVCAVYPKLDVHLPLGAEGGERLFGRPIYADLFMTGLDPRLVRSQNPEFADSFTDDAAPIPVVLSPQLLQIYNASVAPSLGTPTLQANLLRGFGFNLRIGQSIMLGSRGARAKAEVPAVVLGESPFAMRLGISVPLAAARRLVATYGASGTADSTGTSSAILRLRRPSALPEVVRQVEALGLQVDEQARQTQHIFGLLLALGAGLGALLLGFAALGIGLAFAGLLAAKRRDFAIYRSVGASTAQLLGMGLVQATGVGLCGGLGGLGLARLAAWGVELGLQQAAAALPLLPPQLFIFSGPLVAYTLGCSLLAAWLGALLPTWAAARVPLVEGLQR